MLLEDDAKPVVNSIALDEATVAALLAQAQADANFNALSYGFFNDPTTTANGLLGELEPDGGLGGLEDGGALEGPQADLSALADFDPVDLAQLASWGSIDANSADPAVLAAALAAAGGMAAATGSSALAPAETAAAAAPAPAGSEASVAVAVEGGVDGAVEGEKPVGAEPVVEAASSAVVEGASVGLQGLSLGAGFE
jgi:hypothetical protein